MPVHVPGLCFSIWGTRFFPTLKRHVIPFDFHYLLILHFGSVESPICNYFAYSNTIPFLYPPHPPLPSHTQCAAPHPLFYSPRTRKVNLQLWSHMVTQHTTSGQSHHHCQDSRNDSKGCDPRFCFVYSHICKFRKSHGNCDGSFHIQILEFITSWLRHLLRALLCNNLYIPVCWRT